MAADLFETYVVTVGATMVLTALLVKTARRRPAGADGAAAADRRRVHPHLDPRHLFRPPRQGHQHHGRDVQGLRRHRRHLGDRDLLRRPNMRWATSTRRSPPAPPASPAWTCYWCMLLGLLITGLIIWITEYYTGTNYPPGPVDRQGVGDRPRHQRHPGPGDQPRSRRRCRRWSSAPGSSPLICSRA